MSRGFLGTAATRQADVTLLLEIIMGLALVLGALLARRRCYRAHGWCQSAVVLMNLVVITRGMLPSFRYGVVPSIPAELADSYYLLAGAHGLFGIGAELLTLYIMLVAGTNLLPRRLRFEHYKRWMRAALVLWWLALLLGILTYLRWYVAPLMSRWSSWVPGL